MNVTTTIVTVATVAALMFATWVEAYRRGRHDGYRAGWVDAAGDPDDPVDLSWAPQ